MSEDVYIFPGYFDVYFHVHPEILGLAVFSVDNKHDENRNRHKKETPLTKNTLDRKVQNHRPADTVLLYQDRESLGMPEES